MEIKRYIKLFRKEHTFIHYSFYDLLLNQQIFIQCSSCNLLLNQSLTVIFFMNSQNNAPVLGGNPSICSYHLYQVDRPNTAVFQSY